MPKEVNITVDPRPLDSQGNPQDLVQNPPPYSAIGQPQPQMGYPPPSGGYPNNMGWNPGPPPPQQQQPTSHVYITSPIVVQPTRVLPTGAAPFVTICPNCQHQVTTRVDSETSMVQHLWAMGLCIIG